MNKEEIKTPPPAILLDALHKMGINEIGEDVLKNSVLGDDLLEKVKRVLEDEEKQIQASIGKEESKISQELKQGQKDLKDSYDQEIKSLGQLVKNEKDNQITKKFKCISHLINTKPTTNTLMIKEEIK